MYMPQMFWPEKFYHMAGQSTSNTNDLNIEFSNFEGVLPQGVTENRRASKRTADDQINRIAPTIEKIFRKT